MQDDVNQLLAVRRYDALFCNQARNREQSIAHALENVKITI